MERYNPQEIEKKWQKKWEEQQVYKTEADPARPKYYALEMFPYPSGNLHMGHVRNYSIGDVMARYKTMEGCRMPEERSDAALAHRVERLLDILRRRLTEEADDVDGEEGEEEARDDLVEAEEREL